MVQITGFRALRYAPELAGPPAEVTAPPYDVIDAQELGRLWERNPYNIVRLILPAGGLPAGQKEQGYRLAAERLRVWKAAGALVADAQPSLYLYRQRFALPDGEQRTRQGFFGLTRLSEWGEGVCRHELTLPGPVSDRIRLIEACQANLSSIFGLYSDPQQEIIGTLTDKAEGQAPDAELLDDQGVWHGLWAVSDPPVLQRVASLLRERPLVIADGHHRYTAALAYRNRQRAAQAAPNGAAPWDYVLFYLAAFEDPGLAILPTHQALHGLNGFAPERFLGQMAAGWRVQEQAGPAALLARLEAAEGERTVALGAVLSGPRYCLLEAARPLFTEAPEEALDVSLLRRRLVQPLLERHGAAGELERHLRYTHSACEAAGWVSAGEADVAFIVRPTALEQVRSLALAGRVMPQKSTYFYPKLLSGLVVYDHSEWRSEAEPPRTRTAVLADLTEKR